MTEYSLKIVNEMGLPAPELEEVRLGGMLHDIGKIGMPEAILNKPGRLTDEEVTVVQQHPRIGAWIIDAFNTSRSVLDFVLHHHERDDGQGYPHGLAGEAIPLIARIGKVADSFDAMTSRRPYSNPRTFAEATAILEKDTGTHFDAAVVAAFRRVLEREGPILEENLRRAEAAVLGTPFTPPGADDWLIIQAARGHAGAPPWRPPDPPRHPRPPRRRAARSSPAPAPTVPNS